MEYCKECNGCAWGVITHYKDTPKDERYHECEWHWKILHKDDKRCEHYTIEREG